MIDPNDFIIAKKRKKYKFAKFANSSLCFEAEDWQKQRVDVVELAAGNALFLVELAQLQPESKFVAIDVKADRLQKGAYIAEELGLKNIYFVRARVDQIHMLFSEKSIRNIWLTFADPFPRQRSTRRRLTHPMYLALYEKCLEESGSLLIKHDSEDFFQWSLEQLVNTKWTLREITFDLHNSDYNRQYMTKTTYETRWMSEGKTVKFVKAQPFS